MAERTKFSSYCLYSLIISAIIYPISGHWIWGGGWLANLGFHDFAGSTAVHMVGGVAALVGAKILGPRIGKYSEDGKPNAIPGHSLTLGALGVFILWFCWFGFNGASTVSATGDATLISMSSIFVTTNLAAATAATVTMIITWIKYKKPDVSMTLNGALGGLVAITAGCDLVSPTGAFIIGIISSIVVVYGVEFVDKVLKIDDPVGAIGVHCFCGAIGTILTGLLSTTNGLFYGGGFKFLGIQIIGVVSVFIWVLITMTIVFLLIKRTIGLRVSENEELTGLDINEHGIENSYADFMPVHNTLNLSPQSEEVHLENLNEHKDYPKSNKFTKVVIVTNPNKFEALKNALSKIGIAGMTITNVNGYGMQKGNIEYYRGVPIDIKVLPKIKIEIVVAKIPPQEIIDTAKKILYTGNIGDGKIFVYNVENVVKIRTGEEGYDALQYDNDN